MTDNMSYKAYGTISGTIAAVGTFCLPRFFYAIRLGCQIRKLRSEVLRRREVKLFIWRKQILRIHYQPSPNLGCRSGKSCDRTFASVLPSKQLSTVCGPRLNRVASCRHGLHLQRGFSARLEDLIPRTTSVTEPANLDPFNNPTTQSPHREQNMAPLVHCVRHAQVKMCPTAVRLLLRRLYTDNILTRGFTMSQLRISEFQTQC